MSETIPSRTLTQALLDNGMTHTKSQHDGCQDIWKDGVRIGTFDVIGGWSLVLSIEGKAGEGNEH